MFIALINRVRNMGVITLAELHCCQKNDSFWFIWKQYPQFLELSSFFRHGNFEVGYLTRCWGRTPEFASQSFMELVTCRISALQSLGHPASFDMFWPHTPTPLCFNQIHSLQFQVKSISVGWWFPLANPIFGVFPLCSLLVSPKTWR